MSKEEFIQQLTVLSKEELQQFIHKNGKKPKLIPLLTPIQKDNN